MYQFIRNLARFYIRATNKYYQVVNLIKLSLLGAKFGNRCIIHGKLSVTLERNAKLIIGNNFCSLNGRALNPLSRNLCGSFKVNSGGVLEIGDNVAISSTTIWSHRRIKIGNNVDIGANVVIMDSDGHSINFRDRQSPIEDMKNKKDIPIEIGNNVLIGVNSIILKGVTIGDRSIIGAGSVVTKSIPSDCIAAGNPCHVIRYLNRN